jgi:hypothetical protein
MSLPAHDPRNPECPTRGAGPRLCPPDTSPQERGSVDVSPSADHMPDDLTPLIQRHERQLRQPAHAAVQFVQQRGLGRDRGPAWRTRLRGQRVRLECRRAFRVGSVPAQSRCRRGAGTKELGCQTTQNCPRPRNSGAGHRSSSAPRVPSSPQQAPRWSQFSATEVGPTTANYQSPETISGANHTSRRVYLYGDRDCQGASVKYVDPGLSWSDSSTVLWSYDFVGP